MRGTIVVITLGIASTAAADPSTIRPRDLLHFTRVPHGLALAPGQANTHVIFMNKCTGGCMVTPGSTDNRTDHSDIASGAGTLSQFSGSATVWNQTMDCMRNVFSRFNVQITDVDPGTTPHLEIMVAGLASQILGADGQGIGGIADFPCSGVGQCDTFMPNALVFAFANESFYANSPNEICATAAQEIAHTWGLDHVVDASDPMTYNHYNGIRQYKDHQTCGSDCQGGHSPFGLTCTGSGGNATHPCMSTGSTQDEVATITTLFGTNTPDTTPPAVAITSPSNGASVMPGFGVTATVTDDVAVQKAELRIDGTLTGTDTGSPWTWTTPTALGQGSHHVEVSGYDLAGNTTKAAIEVTIGTSCTTGGCTDSTQVCVDGHCVAGPGTPGGLGTVCMMNSDCASMDCAEDNNGDKYCVEGCDPTMRQCPSGFGCLPTHGTSGVCWPGADDGGGGCSTDGGRGTFLLGVGFAALMTKRRRT